MNQIESKLDEIVSKLGRIEKALKIVPDKDEKINDFHASFSAYEEFAREELKLEQNTIDNQKSAILAYLKYCKGIINKETVKAYLNSNESESWKTNQLKALRRYIRDFLKLGNWINEFNFSKSKTKIKKTIPNNEELAQFCNILPYKIQLIFFLMLNSGLRIGEILSLNAFDISLEERQIDASKIHKGKTKHSWFSFFTKQTADLLEEYFGSDEFHFEEGNEDNTKLFSASVRTVQEEFKKASITLGVSINPHLLRTVFTERCREAGIDKDYIDAFCGRIPQGVLAKNYTDYSPKALRKQYDKIESYLTL